MPSLVQYRRRSLRRIVRFVGLEDRVGIERKSLSDLLGCIGGSRDRFERELENDVTVYA